MAKATDVIRTNYVETLMAFMDTQGEETIRTNSNEFAMPVVDADGNEHYVVVTVKVPTGTRDGDAYNAYDAHEEYESKLEKARQRAEKKEADKQKALAKKAKQKS